MEAYIDIPEAKPAFELIDGRLYQKMSPKTRHALLQGQFGQALATWGGSRYLVGPEWRFRISDGERRHALVPDVAAVLKERLRALRGAQYDEPPFAPDLAIEILSPSDSKRLLKIKIDAYLRKGSKVVLVVDPLARSVVVHDAAGERTLGGTDVFEHSAFPDLQIDLAAVFSILDRD